MAVDYDAFREQFPDTLAFRNVAQADIEKALAEAMMLHAKRNLATLYCAAHLLALEHEHYDGLRRRKDAPDGGAGVIASEGIGARRISYLTQLGANSEGWKSFFATSPYGRHFLALEARTPGAMIGARVVG